MISRRLLRVKVLQMLYAFYTADIEDIKKAENELNFSVNKSYELYKLLLLLMIDVRQYAESRIEIARNKLRPSNEDLHPNRRFVENKFIAQIAENIQLQKYIQSTGISWSQYPVLIKDIYSDLLKSEDYHNYMTSENISYENDKQIIINLYANLIQNNDDLHHILEEMSIYWNDDAEYIISMIIKTIKIFREKDTKDKILLPLFKNDEDREFFTFLFRKAVINRDYCVELIKETANNWDIDRIAFIDTIIMQMAITELMEFSTIPTKVTLNEYLDIAKYYSTEKSNSFINGILDKILIKLRSADKIKKTGRGLIGEN